MKRYLPALIVLASLIFCASASAAQLPADVQNGISELRDFRSNDAGHAILNFLMNGGQASPMDVSLLSTISSAINLIALSMMAVLAGVGGVTYVIQTANKGTPGGQVISSFWMPIRIAAATILLIPLSSGYSTIQLGVFEIADAGNNSGNFLMAEGLDYLFDNGIYLPPALPDLEPVVMGLVASEVCKQYANSSSGNPGRIVTNPRTLNDSAATRFVYSYDETPTPESYAVSDPQIGYCGSVGITIPRELGNRDIFDGLSDASKMNHSKYISPEIIQKKFATLLSGIYPKVTSIAQKILSDETALRRLQEYGESRQAEYESAFASRPQSQTDAVSEYVELINEANGSLAGIIASTVNEQAAAQAGASWKDDMKKAGWPALGTLFWQSQQSQSRINEFAKIMRITYTPPTTNKMSDNDQRYAEISTRLSGLQKSASAKPRNYDLDNGMLVSIASSGVDGAEDGIKKYAGSLGQNAVKSLVLGGGQTDLISNMQYSGTVITSTAEILYLLTANAEAVTSTVAKVASFAARGISNAANNIPIVGSFFGAGATAGGSAIVAATTYASKTAEQVGGFVQGLLIPTIIAGFVLAIVLPTIPLALWLTGVVSWMLFFLECLLVSPFWLAAHGTAEKEGWGTEHTRQGYMLMIGLFLNPVLRVAGFFACLIALRPLGILVQWMSEYIQGVLATGWVSPFLIVGSMIMLAIFAYSLCIRVFSLPNELFERGLRWVNGGQEVTGDEKSEHSNRMAVASFTSKSEGAAGRSTGLGRGQKIPGTPATGPTGSIQ